MQYQSFSLSLLSISKVFATIDNKFVITSHDTAENGNFRSKFRGFLKFGIFATLNELITSNPKPK